MIDLIEFLAHVGVDLGFACLVFALVRRQVRNAEERLVAKSRSLEAHLLELRESNDRLGKQVRLFLDGQQSNEIGVRVSHQHDERPLKIEQLVLGEENTPLVRFVAIDAGTGRSPTGTPIPVTTSIQEQLGPSVDHALRVLAGGGEMAQRSLRMVFSPELAKGLKDGSLHLMKSKEISDGVRAIAVNDSGTIKGHASVVSELNPASVALGALQVLSVITAQQYLAAIQQQLAKIEGGITDIKNWLSDEVRGKIRGNSDALRRIAHALQRHEVSDSERTLFAHELQSIDREVTQLLKLIEEQRLRAVANFREKTFKADGWWVLGDSLSEVQKKFELEFGPCRSLAEQTLLAASVRGMSIMLRGALGLNVGHALDLSLELFRENQSTLESFAEWRQELENSINRLKSRYRTEATDKEVRVSLREAVRESFDIVDRHGDELRGQILALSASLDQQLKASSKPTVLEVTLAKDGRIAELSSVI